MRCLFLGIWFVIFSLLIYASVFAFCDELFAQLVLGQPLSIPKLLVLLPQPVIVILVAFLFFRHALNRRRRTFKLGRDSHCDSEVCGKGR